MKLGFFSILFLGILILAGAGFAWLAFTDMPVVQHDITVNVPIQQ